jgi:Domain of unknown function (DUF4386)
MTNQVPHDPTRTTALVAGVLYLVTFLSSIPAFFLLGPVLTDPNYVASAGADGQVSLGALLDLVNALACIGTAVALFSVVKRQHEGFALGFVTTRMFEAAVIAIGVVCILAVVTLRQDGAADGDAAALVPVGQGLVAIRDWTFVIGPGMAGFNALLLGTLMYRSRLVPRVIPVLGLIGGPVYISAVAAIVLGITQAGGAWQGVGGAFMFAWELLLGLWMTFRGFDRAAPIVVNAMAESERSPTTVGSHPADPAQAGAA